MCQNLQLRYTIACFLSSSPASSIMSPRYSRIFFICSGVPCSTVDDHAASPRGRKFDLHFEQQYNRPRTLPFPAVASAPAGAEPIGLLPSRPVPRLQVGATEDDTFLFRGRTRHCPNSWLSFLCCACGATSRARGNASRARDSSRLGCIVFKPEQCRGRRAQS